jgi:electron transport complex protein RnfG
MVLVLTIVTGFWGGALSLVKMATEDQIQYQRLKNVKAPALRAALSVEYTNDPVKDRKTVVVGKDQAGEPLKKTIFFAKNEGELKAVALEAYGTGYEGDIGVMIAIRVDKGVIDGISVTTHAETPGVGTKAIDNPEFIGQFTDKGLSTNFSPQGGVIDAVTGATYTSNGIMKAVESGKQLYRQYKDKILSTK